MATTAAIAVQISDDTLVNYVLSDGYEDWTGTMLDEHFTDHEAALDLVKGKTIRSLRSEGEGKLTVERYDEDKRDGTKRIVSRNGAELAQAMRKGDYGYLFTSEGVWSRR